MAIQKVSDLPILRQTLSDEFNYDRVKASLIELSYKLSSDDVEGVSRYSSRAVTVAEFADYILSAQNQGNVINLTLSGDVFLNTDIDENAVRNYDVIAKTGDINTVAFGSYQLSSADIQFNSNHFSIKNSGQNAVELMGNNMTVASNVTFSRQALVPDITEQSSPYAAVNLKYLRDAIPTVESPFILFETKYLDYSISSRHWINTTSAQWLLSSDFPNAYAHLTSDLSASEPYTVTYTGVSHQFKARKAPDGHIVCQSNLSANVDTLFSKCGIAWIYVIDTETGRFRLPRNRNFIKGCNDIGEICKYMPPTLPEHSHTITYNRSKCDCSDAGGIKNNPHNSLQSAIQTDSTTYYAPVQKGNTVSPPAVQMYLYMYCS